MFVNQSIIRAGRPGGPGMVRRSQAPRSSKTTLDEITSWLFSYYVRHRPRWRGTAATNELRTLPISVKRGAESLMGASEVSDSAARGFSVGIDVGGTFTDLACGDGESLWRAKSPTDPQEFGRGVLGACRL